MFRLAGTAFLALLLAVQPVRAQSFTLLMNRALYLEATAGDVDGAIRIYRQILAGGAGAHVYQADAQYRLGLCLAKQGGNVVAVRKVSRVSTTRREDTWAPAYAYTHIRDPLVGYSYSVPAGWDFFTRNPYNAGPGHCTEFRDPEKKGTATLCAKNDRTPADKIDEVLLKRETELLDSLTSSRQGYVRRAGSPKLGMLNGQRSLTLLGDYNRGSTKMTEWITWLQSEATRASFVVDVPSADLEDFRTRCAPLLNSFRIP